MRFAYPAVVHVADRDVVRAAEQAADGVHRAHDGADPLERVRQALRVTEVAPHDLRAEPLQRCRVGARSDECPETDVPGVQRACDGPPEGARRAAEQDRRLFHVGPSASSGSRHVMRRWCPALRSRCVPAPGSAAGADAHGTGRHADARRDDRPFGRCHGPRGSLGSGHVPGGGRWDAPVGRSADGRVIARVLGGFDLAVGGSPVTRADWQRLSAERLVKLLLVTPGHRVSRRIRRRDPLAGCPAGVGTREPAQGAPFRVARPGRIGPRSRPGTMRSRWRRAGSTSTSTGSGRHSTCSRPPRRRTRLDRPAAARAEPVGRRPRPEVTRSPPRWTWSSSSARASCCPTTSTRTGSSDRANACAAAGCGSRSLPRGARRSRGGSPAPTRSSPPCWRRDPTDEAAHRLAMELYAREGRHHAVRRQYAMCRHALRTGLDVDPSPETEEAYARAERSATRAVQPAPAARLVARQLELQRIEPLLDHVASGRSTSLLIRGSAGIGKTRLLQEVVAYARAAGWAVIEWQAAESSRSLAYAPFRVGLVRLVEPDEVRRWDEPARSALTTLVPGLGRGSLRFAAQPALVTGLVAAIDRIARSGPLMLAIDDVSWLDDPSRDVLRAIALRPAGPPRPHRRHVPGRRAPRRDALPGAPTTSDRPRDSTSRSHRSPRATWSGSSSSTSAATASARTSCARRTSRARGTRSSASSSSGSGRTTVASGSSRAGGSPPRSCPAVSCPSRCAASSSGGPRIFRPAPGRSSRPPPRWAPRCASWSWRPRCPRRRNRSSTRSTPRSHPACSSSAAPATRSPTPSIAARSTRRWVRRGARGCTCASRAPSPASRPMRRRMRSCGAAAGVVDPRPVAEHALAAVELGDGGARSLAVAFGLAAGDRARILFDRANAIALLERRWRCGDGCPPSWRAPTRPVPHTSRSSS